MHKYVAALVWLALCHPLAAQTIGYNRTNLNTAPTNLNYRASAYRAYGTNAGSFTSVEGTAPAVTTNAITIHSPVDVDASGWTVVLPGTMQSGLLSGSLSGTIQTLSFVTDIGAKTATTPSFGDDDTSVATTAFVQAALSGTLYRTRTTISISNTVTETTFLTNNLTAGIIGTNKEIVIRAGGKLLQTTGSSQTYTFRMYLAGTEVYEDASPSVTSSASTGIWMLTVRIVAMDATNIQSTYITLDAGGRGAVATGTGDIGIATPVWYGRVLAASTADSTASMGVGFTIVNGATGVMDWTIHWATITVE